MNRVIIVQEVADQALKSGFGFSDLLDPLTTLLATFLGAGLAFVLQNIHSKEQRKIDKRNAKKQLRRQRRLEEERAKDSDIVDGLSVYASLVQLYELIATFNEHLKGYAENPYRHIFMPSFSVANYSQLLFNESNLKFLVDKDMNLVSSILRCARRAESTIVSINGRSESWRKLVKPVAAPLEDTTEGVTAEAVLKRLPKAAQKEMKQTTDAVFERVREDLDELKEIMMQLAESMKRHYPDREFPTLQFLTEEERKALKATKPARCTSG
jgi:hypothetical protein